MNCHPEVHVAAGVHSHFMAVDGILGQAVKQTGRRSGRIQLPPKAVPTRRKGG